jgi:hypothetical protein
MVSVLPSPSARGVFYWLATGMLMITAFTITNQLVGNEIQTMLSKKE